jgi:hypothetical protein
MIASMAHKATDNVMWFLQDEKDLDVALMLVSLQALGWPVAAASPSAQTPSSSDDAAAWIINGSSHEVHLGYQMQSSTAKLRTAGGSSPLCRPWQRHRAASSWAAPVHQPERPAKP